MQGRPLARSLTLYASELGVGLSEGKEEVEGLEQIKDGGVALNTSIMYEDLGDEAQKHREDLLDIVNWILWRWYGIRLTDLIAIRGSGDPRVPLSSSSVSCMTKLRNSYEI